MSATNYLNITTSICILFGALRYLYVCWQNSTSPILESLVTTALTAGSIPVGFILVICGINFDFIKQFEGINLYLTLAGICVLFIAVRQML